MLAMFLIGLTWIVVFYVTDGSLPIDKLDNWNIVVGFGFIAAGFGVSTSGSSRPTSSPQGSSLSYPQRFSTWGKERRSVDNSLSVDAGVT